MIWIDFTALLSTPVQDLKVNILQQTFTSFDTFTLETTGQSLKGRAFYGSSKEKILRLLNLTNGNFSLSLPLPL